MANRKMPAPQRAGTRDLVEALRELRLVDPEAFSAVMVVVDRLVEKNSTQRLTR